MKEACFNIRGKKCKINIKGGHGSRLRVRGEIPFTATRSELRTLILIAQGLNYKQIGQVLGTTEKSLRKQTVSLRNANKFVTMTTLISRAEKLDLLNPLALEGFRVVEESLKNQGKITLINVTTEFKKLAKVKV